jgi:hypothetical protein
MNRDILKRGLADVVGGGLACREFVEIVTHYLEGSLSLPNQMRFHMHWGICLGCRRYLRSMRQMIRTLGRLPAEPMAASVRIELIQRFRTRKAVHGQSLYPAQ